MNTNIEAFYSKIIFITSTFNKCKSLITGLLFNIALNDNNKHFLASSYSNRC